MTGAAPPLIDLNADLGESFGTWRLGDDEALLTLITSANVACGFHAGDPLTLQRTCANAVANGVVIGAQVSYRDLAGFGRREMVVPPAELTAEVLYQIAALDGIARSEGGRVSYVKPHGALYNRSIRDVAQAKAIVEAICRYDPALPLLTLPHGEAAAAGREAGLTVVAEAFADRAYLDDGTLMPRGQPGAVLTDAEQVAARAVGMATRHLVTAASGQDVPVPARSLCIHGDTAGAVGLARAVRAGLASAGVTVAPFA